MIEPADAWRAAAILALDPARIGGIVVRARVGPHRDRWVTWLRRLLPGPQIKLPIHATPDRLLGGIDLAATLGSGRVCYERGLLPSADGGTLFVPMAERLEPSTTALLATTLDRGEAVIERDGLARREDARFGVVALDEGINDERTPRPLLDRLAIHLDLEQARLPESPEDLTAEELNEDRHRYARGIAIPEDAVQGLCATAAALGIDSCRAPLLALEVARGSAALEGRDRVDEEDLTLAARLVLAPRARCLPEAPPPEEEEPTPPENEADDAESEDQTHDSSEPDLDDVILEAARAALPANVLEQLKTRSAPRGGRTAGPSGARRDSAQRGRARGTRRGPYRSGARLNVVETLRAAAPWQRIRQPASKAHGDRLQIRGQDFRMRRFVSRTETTTIFAVDASGSAAFQRLAEAKGAVEQVLADCYSRRDHVALLSFRGAGAHLLLPPTRSLVRAKRLLAELPGGGATPLALGIDAAFALAEDARARGHTAIIVVMTDGRANVTRDGQPDRVRAAADAIEAGRRVRQAVIPTLFVDTSPRPQEQARRLAAEMDALYLPLPYADARGISSFVQSAR